jgi:type III secretion protein R
MVGLTILALLPFLLITMTSFTKIVVVLGILRNALGAPQVPPTTVITGLALMLTGYVMLPTGTAMYEAAAPLLSRSAIQVGPSAAVDLGIEVASRVKEPIRTFLARHAHPRDRALFRDLKQRRSSAAGNVPIASAKPADDGFAILAPAFLISQLREAFTIGFLLFIPFLVIDLVVSNLLLALGMQMLQPTTVSLPFKLLLFVMVDGWHLLARGLVLGYA